MENLDPEAKTSQQGHALFMLMDCPKSCEVWRLDCKEITRISTTVRHLDKAKAQIPMTIPWLISGDIRVQTIKRHDPTRTDVLSKRLL